jgi:hypothetical protein
MSRMKSIQDGVKYTVVLPESDIQQLKLLTSQKKISSVNAGVREAVETYLARQKQESYKQELQEAMSDPEFLRRNEHIGDAFKHADREADGNIAEW